VAEKAETLYELVAARKRERGAVPGPVSVADELPDLQEVNLYS